MPSAAAMARSSGVNGLHRDGRVFAARILAHVYGFNRLNTGDQNHQVHHNGEHRPLNE